MLERSHDKELVAVMCAGLDHFAQINQALGTDRADHVLKAVADRLSGTVRDGDIFGRLRGDVFTLIAPGVRDEAEIRTLAERLRAALSSRPITVGKESVTVGATVGVATGRAGIHGSDMISEAANAMREAKHRRDRVWVSDDRWSARAAKQVRLRDGLRGALDRGEIRAVFQPIVELQDGKLRGFEALARWHSPKLGEVSPAEFIPLAELSADIIPIGEWMLEVAAGQIAEWRAEVDPELSITFNVSPLQLEQTNFAEVVAATLSRFELPGEAIGLEITEGSVLETGVVQQRNLERLGELRTRIVLDDFGTGYSALSYLRRFAFDMIKIDRSFIETAGEDRTTTSLVQAILTMSNGLELDVVAEGIETEEQAKLLRLLGCRYGQGYLFGRPVAAAEVRSSSK